MKRSQREEKILSYNDVVLWQSDLDILNGPYYLNDRIIDFYFSYVSSCYSYQDILLVSPSIAFWIMQCPVVDSLGDFIEPLHFPDKALVVFPINDNDDVDMAEGGSHWSLVAYYRNANVFVHHDSCRGLNAAPAKKLYKAVAGYMGSASEPSFLECTNSPMQDNGYDCGLYVTATTKIICNWHANHKNHKSTDTNDLWFSDVKEQVTASAVANMRGEIMALIMDLMERR